MGWGWHYRGLVRLLSACEAEVPMDADDSTAFAAAPPLVLLLDEGAQTMLADVLEVLEHAHPVIRSVSLVQVLQPLAGEFLAFVTESGLACLDPLAVLDDASDAGGRLVGVISAAAGARTLVPEVRKADSAIHPARGNEFSVECHRSCSSE